MFSFANPALLLAALAVPVLLVWRLRQRRGALRFSDTRLLAGLPAGRSRFARWAGFGGRALALLLLVGALAGPRWPDLRTRITTEGIAIELVVDVSGSMAEPDFDWQGLPITRLDAVKQVLRLFVAGGEGPAGETLEGRAADLIGFVTFDDRPEGRCPLTLSHSALLHLLDSEQPRAEATNLGDALAWGLKRVRQAGPRRRILVLFTDGYHNVPDPQALKPRQAAQLAAALQVPIYVVDAGRESEREGETAADRARAVQTFREVARMTGGQYFEAGDTQALLAACREIDHQERGPIQSFHYRRFHEGFVWFGLAALIMLAAVQVMEMTLWRRLP
jgi:Ca-activated chloride channel family protein